MISAAPALGRQLARRPIGARIGSQWQQLQRQQQQPRPRHMVNFQRHYAEIKTKTEDPNTKPRIHDSDTVVLPGTQSSTASNAQPPPPGSVFSPTSIDPTPATPTADKTIPPESIPRIPLPPSGVKTQTAPPTTLLPKSPATPPSSSTTPAAAATSSPPPPPPPPPPPAPKKKKGRFRRFLLALILLTGLGFGGGTYYSLVSDNFHDFFTEYVPFGEDAVLYFEEREYRKRFPNLTNPSNRPKPDLDHKITIPSKSGVSWKVAGQEHQTSDATKKDKHMSATGGDKAQQNPAEATAAEKTKAAEKAKKDAPPASATPKPKETKPSAPPPPPASPASKKESEKSAPPASPKSGKSDVDKSMRPPEVNEPSRFMPIAPIDPLKIKNADEPLVQDLVKIFNDIITVVNNDGASYRYKSSIDKAKSALAGVGASIINLKSAEKGAAEEWKKSKESEFDTAAKELVGRLEEEMRKQEGLYREEFEGEREKIAQSYQARLQAETDRVKDISEQRIKNQLLEQAIALKKQFQSEVTARVETERNGRLGKLSDLSSSLTELDKLTAEWNNVIDSNLKTQHVQVAVEAVRSLLENTNRPVPFVHELAALKELTASDPVINAAIGSIHPSAYQRGVPTSAQLIDRFRRVAAEVRKAALLPEDAGVASHAASYVLSNVLFKKRGMTVGDDVESVLTRTETLLEEGNLDEAAREMNGLTGWAKTLSGDWLSECRRVLEVRQALDVMATEARLEGLKVDG